MSSSLHLFVPPVFRRLTLSIRLPRLLHLINSLGSVRDTYQIVLSRSLPAPRNASHLPSLHCIITNISSARTHDTNLSRFQNNTLSSETLTHSTCPLIVQQPVHSAYPHTTPFNHPLHMCKTLDELTSFPHIHIL